MPNQTELRPDWFEAQIELVRLQKLMAELEAGRGRGRSTFPLRLVRDRLERHVERWASTWAKEAAALMAQFEDVSSHLSIAAARLEETNSDQVTLEHICESLKILEEREKYMITIGSIYQFLEQDYAIQGRKTLRNIKQAWENHLKAAFGHLPANGLSADAVTIYIARRQQEGAKNATINRETAYLRRAFTLAIRTGKITRRPFIQQLPEKNTRSGFVKDSQFGALARETGKIGKWFRAMFEISAVYGFRKSELLRLRVRQLDFFERSIVLDTGQTKNGEGRQVGMTDEAFDLLKQCVAGKAPEDFVFTRERESNGRRTKTRDGHIVDFRDDWARACLAAGCHGLRWHDLRRTAVRGLIRAGVQQKTAMAVTGHLTPSVFERYNIIDEQDLIDAARKLQDAAARRREQQARPVPAERSSSADSTSYFQSAGGKAYRPENMPRS